MVDFIYPSSEELCNTARTKIENLVRNRIAFQLMPIQEKKTNRLSYDMHDGTSITEYNYPPSRFGEVASISDRLLMSRMNAYGPIDITDLVESTQEQLVDRTINRMEHSIWELLCTGTIQTVGFGGVTLFEKSILVRLFAAGIPWASLNNATPLKDIRAAQALFGGDWDASAAKLLLNPTTARALLGNINRVDIDAKDSNNPLWIGDYNAMALREDLPQMVVCNELYANDDGKEVPLFPDGKALIVKNRPKHIGEFVVTSNDNYPDADPGVWIAAIQDSPLSVDVYSAMDGGPCLYRLGDVVVMNV